MSDWSLRPALEPLVRIITPVQIPMQFLSPDWSWLTPWRTHCIWWILNISAEVRGHLVGVSSFPLPCCSSDGIYVIRPGRKPSYLPSNINGPLPLLDGSLPLRIKGSQGRDGRLSGAGVRFTLYLSLGTTWPTSTQVSTTNKVADWLLIYPPCLHKTRKYFISLMPNRFWGIFFLLQYLYFC